LSWKDKLILADKESFKTSKNIPSFVNMDKKSYLEMLVEANEAHPDTNISKLLETEEGRRRIQEYAELSILVAHVTLIKEEESDGIGYRDLVGELKKFASIFKYSTVKERINRVVEIESRNAYELFKQAIEKADNNQLEQLQSQIGTVYGHLDFFKTFIIEYAKQIPTFFMQYGLKGQYASIQDFIASSYLFICNVENFHPLNGKEIKAKAEDELLQYNVRSYISNFIFIKEGSDKGVDVTEMDAMKKDPGSLYKATERNLLGIRNAIHKNISDLVLLMETIGND
jgi:hypothetical protein